MALKGTPQVQTEQASAPTSIPIETVNPDQLPRERGWTYDDMALIVGSLYLDTHQRIKITEEQFKAVSDEYERRYLQLEAEAQAKLAAKQKEVDRLVQEVGQLRRELETVNGKSRPITVPSPIGTDKMSNQG